MYDWLPFVPFSSIGYLILSGVFAFLLSNPLMSFPCLWNSFISFPPPFADVSTFFVISYTSPLSANVAGNFKVILSIIFSVIVFKNQVSFFGFFIGAQETKESSTPPLFPSFTQTELDHSIEWSWHFVCTIWSGLVQLHPLSAIISQKLKSPNTAATNSNAFHSKFLPSFFNLHLIQPVKTSKARTKNPKETQTHYILISFDRPLSFGL
jgi:hypothetical protein